MELQMVPQYRILITPQEFRVISKALRGIPLTPDERQEAAALQEKMLIVRAATARQYAESVQKDADNVGTEAGK